MLSEMCKCDVNQFKRVSTSLRLHVIHIKKTIGRHSSASEPEPVNETRIKCM